MNLLAASAILLVLAAFAFVTAVNLHAHGSPSHALIALAIANILAFAGFGLMNARRDGDG